MTGGATDDDDATEILRLFTGLRWGRAATVGEGSTAVAFPECSAHSALHAATSNAERCRSRAASDANVPLNNATKEGIGTCSRKATSIVLSMPSAAHA